MANWLSKYEQGGMVLKQKTKDNYGKQGNYNDAKVSTPPGYVGLGYDTKGRNYSPAWGGQFQMGGILGKTFLQPNSSKLPAGPTPGGKKGQTSTELSMSIGGEKGEPGYLIPTFKHGKPLADPEAEFRQTGEHIGGPFKTWQAAEKWGKERHKFVEKGQSVPSPTKTWDEFAMGGSIPGAVGFTYARVAGSAPANGKYTKKTKASAQNGKEMRYWQEGLDFKPKTISKNGGWLDGYNDPIKDDMGQWAHPGEVTEINSNEITMKGVPYNVIGISDKGDVKDMKPGKDYKFKGSKVTEYPKGGWLNKYK